jgi:DNA topoisomerase I
MPRLRRSDTSGPGFTRVRAGRGFSYRGPDGSTVTDAALRRRFADLAIPPAWTHVWICPFPNGHIQATGIDDAGRKQYLYHPYWRQKRDRVKFDRALQLATTLPSARGQVTRALRANGQTRERALAAAFRMLDMGALRIGSEQYAAEYGSHGLSTLLCSHARVRGSVTALEFPAKSGQWWESEIDDADLARFVRSRRASGEEARLLAWRDGDGWRALSTAAINDFVRERTGGNFTAKDFRTLHGTVAAAVSLAEQPPASTKRARTRAITEAMRAAAAVLGNTPAIARASYVDPRVVDQYLAGVTIQPARSSSGESALVAMLAP